MGLTALLLFCNDHIGDLGADGAAVDFAALSVSRNPASQLHLEQLFSVVCLGLASWLQISVPSTSNRSKMDFEIDYTGVAGIWEAHSKSPPLYLAITDLALGSKNILRDIPSEVYSFRASNGIVHVFEIVYYQVPPVSTAQAMLYIEALWFQFRDEVLGS